MVPTFQEPIRNVLCLGAVLFESFILLAPGMPQALARPFLGVLGSLTKILVPSGVLFLILTIISIKLAYSFKPN